MKIDLHNLPMLGVGQECEMNVEDFAKQVADEWNHGSQRLPDKMVIKVDHLAGAEVYRILKKAGYPVEPKWGNGQKNHRTMSVPPISRHPAQKPNDAHESPSLNGSHDLPTGSYLMCLLAQIEESVSKPENTALNMNDPSRQKSTLSISQDGKSRFRVLLNRLWTWCFVGWTNASDQATARGGRC